MVLGRRRKILFLLLVVLSVGCIVAFFNLRNGIVQHIPTKQMHVQPSPSRDLNSAESKIFSNSAWRDRQAARKALIRKYCKQALPNAKPTFKTLRAIPPHQILYCLTPKCASRQWRQMLFRINSINVAYLFTTYPQNQQEMMLKSYFKFTFVREPFERLLSAYKDKFLYPRKDDRKMLEFYGTQILKHFRSNASRRALQELNDITFPEFIQYLVTYGSNQTTRVMNWHWNNYENLCGFCATNYDFIGHYETLEEDVLAFKQAVGKDFRSSSFRNITVSKTSTELLKYYSQIPLEWINKLGAIYKSSFEMFNYSFPGPLESLFESS